MLKQKNLINNLRILLTGLFILLCISLSCAQTIAVPDGYAGYSGTIGGGNATPDTVSTASDFKSAVTNDNPAIIVVDGRIDIGGDVSIGSNKTIVGANSSSGLYGGTIKIQETNNIIQNLSFGPSDADVMEASGATNIYVTQCEFYDSQDELFSIVREADYVTVSWCKFYFDNPTSHSFAHLIGNSDDRTSDRGKLHVTMHHNWYAHDIVERMPRVRFGNVHIYNNYYNSEGNGYCIGTGVECHIRLENSYFDNVNQLWKDWDGVSSGGEIGWHNLKLVDCTVPTYFTNSYPVYSLPYNYVLDPVDSVKSFVKAGAGNIFGVDNSRKSIQVSISSPMENDTLTNSSIMIEADATISEGTIESIQFYHGNELIGVSINEPFSVTWENVDTGDFKIIAKAFDSEGYSAFSDIINITVVEEDEVTKIKQEIMGFDLFPNPVSNDLIIQLKGNFEGNTYVNLYNSIGKKVLEKTLLDNENILDFKDIPSGVYIIYLTSNEGIIVRKIIKK
ncbi:T9SS type A sorting domain-containing protein [Bacteroidota bacterium]